MLEEKVLRGDTTKRIIKCVYKKEKQSDYRIKFFKGETPIAEVYYHPGAKQCIIETIGDVGLMYETLKDLLPFVRMTIADFRTHRRMGMCAQKLAARKSK